MSIKNKTIIITGGAGFIGSHLAEKLSRHNEVFSLDNYLTGSTENHVERVEYIEGDAANIADHCKSIKPDMLFHLGEYSRVESSFEDYDLVINNNLNKFSHVLQYANSTKCKIIYSGSSTKFGDSLGGSDASPYAWTKSTNTKHLINYANWYGLNYAIVYFYNAYGGREKSTGKYSTLIAKYQKLLSDGEVCLPVVKPGTQQRNFTHYSDIVSALELVGEKANGDGYGIGADKSYSILDVVNLFKAEISFLDERKGNRATADLITSKTKELGWQPKVSLEEYILNFLETLKHEK